MTSAAARRPDPPPPIWHCTLHLIACRWGHPYLRIRDASMNVQMRVDGHIYLECPACKAARGYSSFAFGVAHLRPHAMVTFYDCSADQYRAILELPDDAETLDVLRFLGYHPPAA